MTAARGGRKRFCAVLSDLVEVTAQFVSDNNTGKERVGKGEFLESIWEPL